MLELNHTIVLFPGRCIINVSPIEFGHCLFVPYGELPQVLTLQSIQSALKLMLLSRQRNFKMAFNREVYKSLFLHFLHFPFCRTLTYLGFKIY